MMVRLFRALSVVMLVVATVVVPGGVYGGPVRLLTLGGSVEGFVPVGDDWQATQYQITVPDDVFALSVTIEESPADLDLFLMDAYGDVIAYAEYTDFNETLFISRTTEPVLRSGRFTVEVAYQYGRPPVADGQRLRRIPFVLRVDAVRLDPVMIAPGEELTGTLEPDSAMARLYRIPVDSSTEALRVDISDTAADVDLFLSFDALPADPYVADHIAQTLRGSESILIDRSSDPPLREGTYYLLVADQVTRESAAPFRLTVTAGRDVPRELRSIPVVPESATDLERALRATVEVLSSSGGGGSGCVVHPEGIVLTNWHVVRADSGGADSDITIGVSLDFDRPPVELYSAEVIEYSEERDLALLRITGDRYGAPLGELPDLPYHLLRDAPVEFGTVLQFVGYPGIGGTGSRASVTYTRGVVAGFYRSQWGQTIKTDGEINWGSSGGAALDDQFRLVGVPTSIMGEDSGQLGYIVPVDAIPAHWLRHLR
jgi:S1-C subfamily serine protease